MCPNSIWFCPDLGLCGTNGIVVDKIAWVGIRQMPKWQFFRIVISFNQSNLKYHLETILKNLETILTNEIFSWKVLFFDRITLKLKMLIPNRQRVQQSNKNKKMTASWGFFKNTNKKKRDDKRKPIRKRQRQRENNKRRDNKTYPFGSIVAQNQRQVWTI